MEIRGKYYNFAPSKGEQTQTGAKSPSKNSMKKVVILVTTELWKDKETGDEYIVRKEEEFGMGYYVHSTRKTQRHELLTVEAWVEQRYVNIYDK